MSPPLAKCSFYGIIHTALQFDDMGKKIFSALLVTSITIGGYAVYKYLKYHKEDAPPSVSIESVIAQASTIELKEKDNFSVQTSGQNNLDSLPEELNLNLPFFPQAPYGNWDYPWQEACEEAAVLLVANIYLQKNWNRAEFNEQILDLVEWEKKRFGAYEHTTVEQTTQILEEYFHLKTRIHDNPSFDQVKEILNRGNLIIMTFAGKRLYNPFYRNGGPLYHAMVIKGYKKGQKVITHDVGTRRGENYIYRWSVIWDALHDYAEPIEEGKKKMIEVLH